MAKKAATTVVDDDDEEVAEVEDTEEADSETETIWGVQDLIKLVHTKTGKTYKPREVRTQLRAMARSGRINREIIPGNKQRYSWSGPDDPEVKAFLKAVKANEIEANKKAALDKLKSDKAKKNAAKAKEAAPAKGKGKTAPPADDDDEEDED